MAEGIRTPSGMGGLLRYDEEYPSKFQLSPQQVIILIAVVVVVMIILSVMKIF